VDLTPRTVDAAVPTRRRRRRWLPMLLLGLVIVAGGVVVTQFLTSAIDYYCNVDEIGVTANCDSDRRLRVQGVVDEGSVADDGVVTEFTMSFNGATLPVRYEGDPGGIFQECIAVVVHGRIGDDGVFDGDRIEVKHSNEYVEANPGRVDDEYDEGSPACSLQP
jgi:cytochrome c-type biogenesis protein CcmE